MTLNTVALGDDVVDRIMTFCPTFSTLGSTILVSKTFYNVFQAHPMSIVQAVAYNVVGPALPQALRVVRYPYRWWYREEWEEEDEDDPDPSELAPKSDSMAEACPEEHSASVITYEEQRKLLKNAEVINEFENIYSLTQKDRTSKTSVLTWEESWRFRRAAYRIMLYCNLFPASRYDLDQLSGLEEDEVRDIQQQRTALLSTYPTDELLQLYAVARFMRDAFVAVASSNDEPHSEEILDAVLGTGPDGVTRAWKRRSIDGLEAALYIYNLFTESDARNVLGYFETPLANIWDARGIEAPEDGSQCATPGGLKLLTEANWDRLPLMLTDLLKNKLKSCLAVTKPFIDLTEHIYNSDAQGPWIAGMFALKETPGAWDGWEREMSYCQPCLTKFLEDHVWKWFLRERLMGKARWVPQEDCEYGYDCKMAHRNSHASTKNHLCAPIKGDV
ncbi:hypothetical protein B0H12DRAFT_603819 [Mycena haematopus]|nr:hypothetical protein B0H12DRAFT_603819 [Mycena haematopus]